MQLCIMHRVAEVRPAIIFMFVQFRKKSTGINYAPWEMERVPVKEKRTMEKEVIGGNRVSDPDPRPDPDWIRIQSGQWIRIRIQEGENDPQK